MNDPLNQEWEVCFRRQGRGASKQPQVQGEASTTASTQPVRLSRMARLMALAIRMDHLIRSGEIKDQAEAARLARVSRARVSQIMNLLNLAPDLQERLLFLTRRLRGRDRVHLARMQPIAATFDWKRQRRLWRKTLGT